MISGPEIAVIAIVVLLLFGPDKIPQILKTLKKAAGLYAEARDQVQDVVTAHVISPEELEMLKDPLGIGGGMGSSAGSKSALLTPERKSLYNQTMPVPEAHVSAPPTLPSDPSPAPVAPAIPAASTEAVEQVPSISRQAAGAEQAASQQQSPGAQAENLSPTAKSNLPSTAASIWASLEQGPSVQDKDGS